MNLAMAATYDPSDTPEEEIRLPFDLETLEMDPQRWQAWVHHDPLNLVGSHVEQLSSLRLLYLDVGSRDQYNIQFGTRAFVRRLEKLAIKHHFEEFDGTHSGLDWRLDISLPLLAKALDGSSTADAILS